MGGDRRRRMGGPGSDETKRRSGTARDRALGMLGVRWRSEAELRTRLRAAGFPDDEIAEAIGGLARAGLIDDERFATEVVRDQSRRRGSSARAMRSALRQKGVAESVADRAVAEAGSDDERALDLARARAQRLSALEPEAAHRRLYGLLVRRGYSWEVARGASRTALAEVWGDGGPDPLDS